MNQDRVVFGSPTGCLFQNCPTQMTQVYSVQPLTLQENPSSLICGPPGARRVSGSWAISPGDRTNFAPWAQPYLPSMSTDSPSMEAWGQKPTPEKCCRG